MTLLDAASSPLDVPGLPLLGRTRRADAARTVALLAAHAGRGLVTADGPTTDDQVVRSATQLLRGHQPWART